MDVINKLKTRLSVGLWNFHYKWIMPLAVRYRWIANLYYCCLSSAFAREHHAVLAGKYMHLRGESVSLSDSAAIRRNIHKLEKALISPRLKPIFAESYIHNTVKIYIRMFEQQNEPETLNWAYAVLNAYFDKVQRTPVIERAYTAFRELGAGPSSASSVASRVPYKRKDGSRSSVNYADYLQLCKQRRSVRYYRQEPVDKALVQKAIEAAALSPSACNRQPFRFIILDKPELIRKASRLPMGTDSFADNIMMLVLVIGNLSAYFHERDRHVIYIDGGLASMSFMLALESLGLSSCPINWPDIEEREAKLHSLFALGPHERCVMFISVGYALDDGMIPYSQKKTFDILASINPALHPVPKERE